MGGGDLNLKKSWHPSTMKNMEKVWKAEQKHEQEQKKIAELQREIREERAREEIQKFAEDQGVVEKKDSMKLDWMYKGPGGAVDREEYLLGKPIDKTFEQIQQAEKADVPVEKPPVPATSKATPKATIEHDCLPPSIFVAAGSEQVDMARKLQEDPLYVIKKKEVESRYQILNNPVKMKQLHRLLKEERRAKRKSRKDKKRKKVRRQRHDSCSDEETNDNSAGKDLDMLLAAKYSKLKDKLSTSGIEDLKKIKNSDSEDEEKEGGSTLKRRKIKQESSDGNDSAERCHKAYGLLKPPGLTLMQSSKRSSSSSDGEFRRPRTPPKRSPVNVWVKTEKKLSEEEKERRRQEMLDNAKWRDKERERNVARYKEEEKKEDKDSKNYSSDFMRKQLSYAASQGSMESRIKSNIYNIQRSGAEMDKNFAKR